VVQDYHKDFRAIDGIMSKTLKEILDSLQIVEQELFYNFCNVFSWALSDL